MRNKLICCIPLALCVVCLFGCASDASRLLTGTKPEMTPSTQQHRPAAQADVPTAPTAALETTVSNEPTPQAPAQSEPVQSTPAEYPTVSPAPVQEAPVPTTDTSIEPAQAAPSEPATTESTPVPTADIYSVDEAMRLGNEYAQTQYGVAIDTSMTTADSGYYPGTVESASWLAANGGQLALNETVCRNVDATFANLAARDGAETVSAYATFSCTVRYETGDYAIVILYG